MFVVNKPLLTTILLCSLVGTCFGGGALGTQSTGRARAAIARATSEQKTTNNTARKTATRAAVTTEKTTAARVTTNAVQSRSNSSAQKTVSKRAATTARAIRARAGETNQQVVMPISGGNTSVVKMYVDDNIASGYENLQKYVELSGNMGYVSLLKDSNKLPNLVTLFENVSEKNTNVRIDGAFTGNDSSNDGDMVYYSNGAAKDSSESIMPGSSIHLIASGKLVGDPSTEPVSGDGNTTNCPSFSATLTAWNRRQGTSISESDARVVGANGTNVADCAIIVTDADGFCRMARWNGNTYGYYNGALTYGDPVVNCDKRNSHLDGTVTVDVGADIDTAYSNMTFESVQVGIEFGQPLPSLAPLNNNRSNKVITLSGVYKTKSMATANGVQSGTGQIWGADGAPAVTSVSNMNSFAYSDYQKMYFAYGVWNKGAATVENTCSNKLSDYQGRMAGDTFIQRVQTTNQSTLSGIKDCAAIVKDSNGLCWVLRMKGTARQLIPCENEKNTYNLGYGMARINEFTPSGYNPDTYESPDTYYFLPWQEHYPVRLMNTYNNNYNLAIILRNPDYYYAQDENGNKGMLQLPDLTNYVNHLTVPQGKRFAGIYTMWEKNKTETYHIDGTGGGDYTFTSEKIYDETGKPLVKYINISEKLPWTYPTLANTGGRPYYMFIIWEDASSGTVDECPSIDASETLYAGANANISNGHLLSVPDGQTISSNSECSWMFTDGDGMCRIGNYNYKPASTTYYDWNGPIVACDTTEIGTDHGFDVDVGPIMDTVPTTFWDQDYLRLEDRLTYRYNKTLPSLEPYVDAAKDGSISQYYTFKGGYIGDSCSITYSNGVPNVGSGCTRIYNDDGTPAKTLSSSDSDELTLAWDYSDNSWANYASICPTTRAEYNKDFNINSGYSFPEDEVSASCTVQRALVTSNNSVISPASDCAILCEDTLGVCYAKTTGQDNPRNTGGSTGMVSCDTTGYVDTTKSVRILDDGSEGNAMNTVRYRTYLKDYAIRSGEHTIIFVQPSNTWPSVSNLIADLYHCGGANSHDGCTNGDDGKTFRGIYTEPNCAGTQIYDENGDYNTSTSVTYEDLPAVVWGDNDKKVYMCWQ